jgi:hypothetical protein
MNQTFIFFRFTPAVPTSFSYPELAQIRRCDIGLRPQNCDQPFYSIDGGSGGSTPPGSIDMQNLFLFTVLGVHPREFRRESRPFEGFQFLMAVV